jgi:hypothetical protein
MSTFIAIALMAGLCVLHLRVRHHAGWMSSAAGRSYFYTGYSLAAFAAFWLTSAATVMAWEWILGGAWALAAVFSFTAGFKALKRVTAEHAERAWEMETIEPATGTISI